MFTVYDAVNAYSKKANSLFYVASKTAIFNNPSNQIYTPKGKKTLVRQYEAGNAGNYSKSKGWMTQYGTGKGVEWIEYKAEFDRAKILSTDALDEAQSYAVGMIPSIDLLNEDFLNRALPREIDATNIAKWYSRTPESNRYTVDQLALDAEHVLDTLNTIDQLVFNSGFEGDVVLFISPDVYSAIISALLNKNGLASGALIKRQMSVNLDSSADGVDASKGNDTAYSVSVNFEGYGRFLLVRVPEDRMYTQITLLSGDPDDAGQEAGGYIPNYASEAFANIKVLAMPIESGFCNVRYMVDNLLYPAFLQTNGQTRVDLNKLNGKMFGNVEINNAGINQKANAFEYDVRCLYGADLFDNRKHNVFAITGPVGSKEVATTKIVVKAAGDATTVGVENTLLLSAEVLPVNHTNLTPVTWSVENGTGRASISESGLLTGLQAGTVTVKATQGSIFGTLVITVE